MCVSFHYPKVSPGCQRWPKDPSLLLILRDGVHDSYLTEEREVVWYCNENECSAFVVEKSVHCYCIKGGGYLKQKHPH